MGSLVTRLSNDCVRERPEISVSGYRVCAVRIHLECGRYE